MNKLLFIYNLHAGKGAIGSQMAGCLEVFTRAGYLVTAYPTQGAGDAARAASEWGPAFDRVVCAGGDGTLSEVISGLLKTDEPPILGYIPTGTTNDFSRNLSLPRGVLKQAAVAVSGIPRPCDIGRFNDKTFVYVAAFGAFTEVSYDTPQPFKSTFGHLAYVLEGMGRLGSLKGYRLRVEHDGQTLEDEFLFGMVSNTVSVGGLKGLSAGDVSLDDGLLEVVLVRQPKTAAELQAVLKALALRQPSEGGPVIAFHAACVSFRAEEELPWTLDGEFGGAPREAAVSALRRAVTIVRGK